jgi:hypothetical protein
VHARRLPWGLVPHRDIKTGVHFRRAFHGPPMFRPRRFSRPRRLTPPILSWACFIPLPRPGFASGVSSRHSVRADSSPSRSSPPLVSSSCRRFRAGAGSRHVDLEGSILVGDPQSPAGRFRSCS